MNLIHIEEYAKVILHSLDPNIKFQAEAAFRELMYSLQVVQYPLILEQYSQNVVFVFLLFLSKQLPKSTEIIDVFRKLIKIAIKWHLSNGEFKRPLDSNYLPYHIANTLGNVMGICMKKIYVQDKSKNDLVDYLKIEPNQLFKLFLYNHFIEVVSSIDCEIEYIRYKVMVNSFQEKMIPIFLQELYPYFISVSDKININELSAMLPTLNESTVKHKFDLFRPEDKMVSQLVFNLLKQIVSFKYNITFSQYDFESESEYFMIPFPESIMNILISKDFLQAFYFMLEKMVSMNYTGSNFDTSFECLKKILLSKFTSLTKEQKTSLMQLHFVGLFRLINANITSEKTMEKVFECIGKFIHAFGLTELQKIHLNHIDFAVAIKQKAIMVVKETQLSCDNHLFSATCQVVCKIVKESIEMSQQKYGQFYKQLSKEFYMAFFEAYITKDYEIMGKSNTQKTSGFVTLLKEFFKYVNNVGGMDMGFLFSLLLSRCKDVFMSENPKKIANYLLLITDIIDENFYDRNVVFQTTPNSQLQILSKLISHCFEFAGHYKKNMKPAKMIDIAIMLFFERILKQCIDNLGNNEETIQISSKTYEVINMSHKMDITDQKFIMFCFNQLQQNLNTQDCQKVQYVLEVLYTALLKLKHTLRRESFVGTQISQHILQKTLLLSQNSLQQTCELLKQRRKLFKIITILSFDDLLDSYRSSIDYVVNSLTNDFMNGKYPKIIFDMSGICQNIEASSIYRYFLTRINQTIGLQLLIKTLYQNLGNDPLMLQEVVHLNYALLSDKSLRMTQKQLSTFIYEIIEYSLFYLQKVLDIARNGIWSEVLNEALTLVNLMFEASYINLFLIKRKSKDSLIAFLYKLMDNLLTNYVWAYEYPELSNTMNETIQLFFTNASQVIITWVWGHESKHQQIEFMNKFIRLFQFTMDLCRHALESAAQSGKNYNLSEKLLETISKMYSFMRYKRNFFHRQFLVETIENIRIQNQPHTVSFLQALYKVSMTNIKNISRALNTICICIMELTFFYPSVYKEIFSSLGISKESVQKIERIYKNIQDFKEDPLFISNLREWLSKSENHYDLYIDY